ncbi:MAG: hypothetical protein M1814_000110 [Vezdaea aestivalis]|nr:MAG: hypothetical protein M1814_000110 [Vezdaea aestivalis]
MEKLNQFLPLLFLVFSALTAAVNVQPRDLNAPLLSSYDYVICGGGISGLVTAMRLTEDPTVSVLVIEAGDPDNYEEFIQVPQFVGTDIGSKYDWNLGTVPQTYLDGATRPMPQGRVLGGGSILNAMCWNRGGQQDYDDWEALGNPGWGWAGMLPYFKKSETYTPAPQNIEDYFLFHEHPEVHGYNGPVQVSYPKYFYNQSRNLFLAMNRLGVPISDDCSDGAVAGASFIPTDIDPVNQTRSDARRTYYDPFISRPNFHVMTGQHVTQILYDGLAANAAAGNPTGGDRTGTGNVIDNGPLFGIGSTVPPPPKFAARQAPLLRARGVQFAADSSAPRQEVTANREVIIACGALHSAQLLQLSGIGPASLLNSFGVPVRIDLPGVGSNMQDHPLVGTFYPYNNVTDSPALLAQNATYNEEARQQYYSSKTGPWTAGSGNGFAFNSLPSISNRANQILDSAQAQDPSTYLVADIDPSVLRGYTVQKEILVRTLRNVRNAIYELLNNNVGSLTVALMKPFSRGTCRIVSADPFTPPAIDPRYGSNPIDLQVYVEALLFNRQILATPEMMELQPAQFVPTVEADEASLIQTIKNGVRTEFHPSCTLAMLPLELGGVVSPELRIYGTQNIRVVDAGIFPMIPAAHLQAVVYAVAEKAADIIRNGYVPPPVLSSTSPSATSSSSSSTTSSMISSATSSISPSVSFSTSVSASSSSDVSTTSSTASATVTPLDTSTSPSSTSASSSEASLTSTTAQLSTTSSTSIFTVTSSPSGLASVMLSSSSIAVSSSSLSTSSSLPSVSSTSSSFGLPSSTPSSSLSSSSSLEPTSVATSVLLSSSMSPLSTLTSESRSVSSSVSTTPQSASTEVITLSTEASTVSTASTSLSSSTSVAQSSSLSSSEPSPSQMTSTTALPATPSSSALLSSPLPVTLSIPLLPISSPVSESSSVFSQPQSTSLLSQSTSAAPLIPETTASPIVQTISLEVSSVTRPTSSSSAVVSIPILINQPTASNSIQAPATSDPSLTSVNTAAVPATPTAASSAIRSLGDLAFPTGDYDSKTPEQQQADQGLVRKIIQFLVNYFHLG